MGIVKRFCFGFILCSVLTAGNLFGAIKFSSRHSKIAFNQTNSRFIVNTALTGWNGTLDLADNANDRVKGTSITFNNGILESGSSEALFTGVYDATDGDKIKLTGGHRFKAKPGSVLQDVEVEGVGNRIEGQPLFSNAITLLNEETTLILALQSRLNQNITLNGGMIRLDDDLRLADDVILTSSGSVDFNKFHLQFGGNALTLTSSVLWKNGPSINLNADIDLKGTWTFRGESVLEGDGHILDLSSGGTLWVQSGTTLHLKDIRIKGLGSGYLVLEDATSQIRISDAEIELDGTVTITEGGFYVNGQSTVFTAENRLIFDKNASVTVDGVTWFYDPDNFLPDNNIRPTDADGVHTIFLNGGSIKAIGSGFVPEDAFTINNSFTSDFDLYLSHNRRLGISNDVVYNGSTHFVHFARTDEPLVSVADGKTLTFEHVVLKDFASNYVSLGTNSKVIFGEGTTIELGKKDDLTQTWSIQGNVVLNGLGNDLELSNHSAIVVLPNSKLTVCNAKVTDLGGSGAAEQNNLRCDNPITSTIHFQDVSLVLSGDYTFSSGHIVVEGEVSVAGDGHTFAYTSSHNGQLTINTDSKFFFDRGVTFSYDTDSYNTTTLVSARDQIVFADASSVLHLNGATFHSTATGARLKTGTLLVDDLVNIVSEATLDSEAIVFDDSLCVNVLASANLNVDGFLEHGL